MEKTLELDFMGSPYLLAHGMGVPVADAETTVTFGFPGLVRAWVRTRDWTPDWDGEKPGRFRLAVGGNEYPETLGVAPSDWGWIDAGVLRVADGAQTVSLKDLTGFEGRCDAVYFTSVAAANPPPNDAASLAAWRAEKRGESAAPDDVVEADLVVVGGGIAGTCAAIAAADAGMTVALVQDRPMLGGNASDEIRVRTERAGNEYHWIVKAVKNTSANAEDKKADDANRLSCADSAGVSTHLGWRAYGVVTNAQRKIVAVDARNVETHYYYDPWWMPYRSLCCRDVSNLFMAGRCASYTHVAFGSSRVMNAGGQQGVAAGYAASLCKKYGCRPREIYQDAKKTQELQQLINKKDEYAFPPVEAPQEREVVSVIVDNAAATGVEISGAWPASSYNSDRYGADYLHNNKQEADDLWVRFTPVLPSNATYRVSLFWNGDYSRGDRVPVEIVHAGGVVTNFVNMQQRSNAWNEIGAWPFVAGALGSVRILTLGQKNVTVIADAVKFAVVETNECPDSDGNGLPDAWERRHFLQTEGTDPAADPDGDGVSNLEEYRRGTNPNRPNLPFTITLANLHP